jgi:hypothetical protein
MRRDGIIMDRSFAELPAEMRPATEEGAPLKRRDIPQHPVILDLSHPEPRKGTS